MGAKERNQRIYALQALMFSDPFLGVGAFCGDGGEKSLNVGTFWDGGGAESARDGTFCGSAGALWADRDSSCGDGEAKSVGGGFT